MSDDQHITLDWAPLPQGATGFSVIVGATEPAWEMPLPKGYRKLDRALRRLEAVVARWERDFRMLPNTTYEVRVVRSTEVVPSTLTVEP